MQIINDNNTTYGKQAILEFTSVSISRQVYVQSLCCDISFH